MAIDKKKKEASKTVVKITDKEDKKKALDTAIAVIEKQFGAGAVMKLGDTQALDVESIPTGSMTLDMALGVGGIPRGRITEIYGPESSGKTTVALHCIAEAQKAGGDVAFIDVEHALDPVYAKALGVNIDELLVSQPDSGEQALEIAEALARSGAIDCLVIDSVAAMVTKAEIDGEMGDTHVGQLARLMSQAMRKLSPVISKSNCAAIFINQVREKIGVIYGNPETTPGGRAPPFKQAEFDIMYGTGISRVGEVLDIATELGIVKKGGAWFSYNDLKLGQGRDNSKIFLLEHTDIMDEIESKIKERSDEVVGSSKKSKKTSQLEEKAAAAAGAPVSDNPVKAVSDDMSKIIVDPSDDFEEFAPVEVGNLGDS